MVCSLNFRRDGRCDEAEFYGEEDMQDLYFVKVKFYSNSIRKALPVLTAYSGRYSPHFVVEGDIEYLGVTCV